jgi:hypothetical protein
MNARIILLGIGPNQTLLVRDQGYYILVSREPNMRFQYQIVHDFPFMGPPDVIRNWLLHHNVLQVTDVYGAIFFIEGFNACWDMNN